jgi:hypothetical protein
MSAGIFWAEQAAIAGHNQLGRKYTFAIVIDPGAGLVIS